MPNKNWELELNEYIRQGEPDKVDKSNAWKTAIGLQAVDGLKTSDYLIETAKEHIEGKISISEADKRIVSYYEERTDQSAKDTVSKCKNCTLEELAIVQELIKNPSITQKELSSIIGKSERTIKTRTVEMQKKGLISRENGKRNGKWCVLIELR